MAVNQESRPAPSGIREVVADAFTAEVIRAAVISITREMKSNLMRTAYNAIIYEAEDFTVGLFDPEGNTISIGLGLPMFIRGLTDAIKAKIDHWGLENIHPGDVLLTNDPLVMGSHLNHMIVTLPVFFGEELVGFSSSMAHWVDIGGVLGGMTRDVYSEGLQIPFVKLYKRGVEDLEISDLIKCNLRRPELAFGDLRAQLAAIRTGERRLLELVGRYGSRVFQDSIGLIFDQSERHARSVVAQIPDGVYEASSFMDDDGVSIGQHIPINVRVEISGDQMTIDLSGVSPQVAGPFNSGSSAGRSAAEVAFKFLTTPTLYPVNYGSFRPLNIILPPGRVISANKGAPVRTWMTIPITVVDTIFRALAEACPDRVIAGHHATLSASRPYGFVDEMGVVRPARGGSGGLVGGGWGAVSDADGQSATVCANDGDTHNSPVEADESKRPVRVIRRELRQDSGGAGMYRGGLGSMQETEVLSAAMYQAHLERTECAPWGLHGGKDALPNRLGIRHLDGTIERFPNGKVNSLRLEPGERYITEMGGGGGYGDPFKRDPERVLADVISGYVSVEAARGDYGVVISTRGEFAIDVEATARLRSPREG
jgi:N-methylhydantoinase B